MTTIRDGAKRRDILARAFAAHQAGDRNAASRIARKLADEPGAQYLIGLCALEDGDAAAALIHLRRAGQLGPDNPALALATGRAYFAKGDVDAALPLLLQAVAGAPKSAAAHHALGLALVRAEQRAESIASLSVAADLAGSDPLIWNDLGSALTESGLTERAIAAFDRAIAQKPDYALAWRNRAAAKLAAGDAKAALPDAQQALSLAPGDRQAAQTLGLALQQAGDRDGAQRLFEAILSARPNDLEALIALGLEAQRRGEHDAALVRLDQALSLSLERADLHFARAESLRLSAQGDAARDAYRRALELDPEDLCGAAAGLALLDGTAAALPDRYLRGLFDDYAPRFDAALRDGLAYRGPELLLEALRDRLPAESLLDLGCGTGLIGEIFHDKVARIDGVDLSTRMVDIARARGRYATLTVASIEPHLASLAPADYTLVIAADVLVYLGSLETLFREVARVLSPGGAFAFTVEEQSEGDYALQPSKRFAHSRRYLESRAVKSGFAVASMIPVSTRRDAGADVPGLLAVLSKP